VTTSSPAPAETLLVRHLARLHGRNPEGFVANILPDGSVGVRSPSTAVFYPPEGWVSRFVRHLHHGFFDLQVVAVQQHA
jgi:hypothetical protein